MNESFKPSLLRYVLPALLVCLAPACLFAQKTEADLQARLVDKPLYLRGRWSSDKLAFDAAGLVQGTSALDSFTLAGIDIKAVKLTPNTLVLDGQRVGLEFLKDVPQRVDLVLRDQSGTSPEAISIEIQTPADGDFAKALDAIFTDSVVSLNPPPPFFWLQYVQSHMGITLEATEDGSSPAASGGDAQGPGARRLARIGGAVSAPHLLKNVEPEFSGAARALAYSGIVLVSFTVEKDGTPTHFRILRAVGLGLDERAVTAASQYTFQPAMENGVPVAVMVNVEVNFQIF